MTTETIVAAFDSPAAAHAASVDVEASGIPISDITQHASTPTGQDAGPASSTPRKEPGFWAKLFGTDDHYTNDEHSLRDHSVYDRTIAGGGSILSIKIVNVEQDGDRILHILEGHSPVDIEERAATYSAKTPANSYASTADTSDNLTGNEQKIELAEEALVVGKRVKSSGTTRIRRYVVETPVSENISLHSETVSVERHPVNDGAVASDAFTDRTIEMTEMNEEAVVGKTARVVEEVVIRKDASDHTETVHDTVRREQVDVEQAVDEDVVKKAV